MISDMFLYLIIYSRKVTHCTHDTTVIDYLCCNCVKCLGPSFTHSSLANDTFDLSDYA